MHNPTTIFSVRRRRQQGQSIIVALLVLVLLGFVGALFLAIVTHNIQTAQRSNRVQTANEYASAGIRFADEQLTYSTDGADWRPPLQDMLAVPPIGTYELARYNSIKSTLVDYTVAPVKDDPDNSYLKQGFTRYNTGAGRFLIRVTYDPVNISGQAVPPGRYIKIEAIGREGNIDPSDPTTYSNLPPTRLQTYLVAFKPIGITDYARFETNPDNRSDTANMGVASMYSNADTNGEIVTPGVSDFTGTNNNYQAYPVVTTYGSTDTYLASTSTGQITPNPNAGSGMSVPAGYTYVPGGGSLRANMAARFYGKNVLYLSNSAAGNSLYNDTVEITGNLLLDSYDPNMSLDNTTYLPTTGTRASSEGQQASLAVNPSGTPTALASYVAPSNSPSGFDTHGSIIRDGSRKNDINGLPRSISRLEPPLMDTVDPASSLPRYKAIAIKSSPRTDPSSTSGAAYATGSGAFGYGQSIYVPNNGDIQSESTTIGSGTTLTDEWLNTTHAVSPGTVGGGWVGDNYNPVGVNIVLGRQHRTVKQGASSITSSFYGIRITRSDASTNTKFAWTDDTGTALTGIANDGNTSSTLIASYKELNASNDPTVASASTVNPNNDVIVYSEGNIRVHGLVSADPNEPAANKTDLGDADDKYPRHITLVTNGTAYIDGNLLKGNPDSSITILAHNYVCINTTQFLAGPQVNENPAGTSAPSPNSDPMYHALDFAENDDLLIQEFNFGLPNGGKPSDATTYNTDFATNRNLALYVSGKPEGSGSTAAQFDLVNTDPNPTTFPAEDFNTNDAASPTTVPLFTLNFDNATTINRSVTDLSTQIDQSGSAPLSLKDFLESDIRQLYIRRDPGATQNLELERVAILPMDIRIEAVLYAQTRSFFVIPGPWFNTNTADTIDNAGNTRIQTDARFPFYGQPIDLKITIDGAVAEARPADISAQSAWMAKWGWIPILHGSPSAAENVAPGHANRIGLQIIYNPQAGYPYNPNNTGGATPHYLRSDIYGRPLPFAPKLPVSSALLYAGQSGEAPILQ